MFLSFCWSWIIIECLFYVYIKAKFANVHEKESNEQEREATTVDMIKILDNISSFNREGSGNQRNFIKDFFQKFFKGAPLNTVGKLNVERFLAWALYNGYTLSKEESEHIQNLLIHIELTYTYSFKGEYNPEVEHIGMCLEPVKSIHQPLFLYLIYWLIQFTCYIILYIWGFRRYTLNSFNYWFRSPTLMNEEEVKNPVIFFHGIAPGWMPYMKFIKGFATNTPVFLFELDCIRIGSLNFSRPSPQYVAKSIKEMIERHEFLGQCKLIGHSFGTILCNWFLKNYPLRVEKIVLLDPVTLLLFLPDVASKFLYEKPSTFFHWIIRIFAAREMTIAHALYRNFDWKDNYLELNDPIASRIPTSVSFSEADELIPVDALKIYLRAHPNVIIWNNLSHAQMMSSSQSIPRLHQEIQ